MGKDIFGQIRGQKPGDIGYVGNDGAWRPLSLASVAATLPPFLGFLYLPGRAGGQSAIGDTAANGYLKLKGAASGTTGSVRILDHLTVGYDVAPSANNLLTVKQLDYTGTITAGTNYVPMLIEFNSAVQPTSGFDGATGIPDTGALTLVVRALNTTFGASQNADFATRVLEPHLFRYKDTGRKRDMEGMEMGLHVGGSSDISSTLEGGTDATFGTTGIWIHSDMGGESVGNLGTGRRANTAFLVTGTNGYQAFCRYIDTDGATNLFSVDRAGTMVLRKNILAAGGNDNAPGTPAYSFELDSDSGMYRVAADSLGFSSGGTNRVTIGPGVQLAAPTGGDKGAGTLNAAGDIYKNNSAYANPDYVFEQAFTGKVEQFKDNPGAAEYEPRSITEMETHVRENLRFPGITDEGAGIFERSDKVLELLEQAYLYIFHLEKRLSALELTV